jgi:hypothetical protein
LAFVDDLRQRLANRVQLTSDGHKPYLQAVEEAFGDDLDYAMLVKLYGSDGDGPAHSAHRKYSPATPAESARSLSPAIQIRRTFRPASPNGKI